MTHDDESILSRIEILSGLGPATLHRLELRCRLHRFTANQVIIEHGDQTQRDLYFVVEGSVRIVNYSSAGREIALANVRQGGYFGELAALTESPRLASVIAVTDCRLASLHHTTFRNLLLDNPEVGIQVIMWLAEIVKRCDQRIMDLSALTAVQRVHAEILRLATHDKAASERWVVRPLPTHAEIASHVSTTRETVARAMKLLAVAGIAERRGRALRIRDYQRLTELIERGAAQTIAAR